MAMTGLAMALKAFGVSIPEEHLKLAEQEIPLLPQRIRTVTAAIDGGLKNFDARLTALEKQNQMILDNQRDMMAVLQTILTEVQTNAGRDHGNHTTNGTGRTGAGKRR
jgi:hypothetical protein